MLCKTITYDNVGVVRRVFKIKIPFIISDEGDFCIEFLSF